MISISTQISDIYGSIIIHEDDDASTLNSRTARVFRSKTLDGGVYISTPVYIDGDRTFVVNANVTKAEEVQLQYLKNQSFLNIACKHGVFSGVIERINCKNGALDMSIFIKERLDEE